MGQRTNAATRTLVAAVTSIALSVSLGGLALAGSAIAAPSPSITKGPAGTMVTTSDLNLRTSPSLAASVVKVVKKGTTVKTTGRTSGTFAEVTIDGADNWLSTKFLTEPASPGNPLPAVKYRATTTATLAMRKTPDISAASIGDVKKGSKVSLTGTHSASYSQIVVGNSAVWVLTGYLNTAGQGPNVPLLPTSAGRRYVGVDEVNVRATSATDGKVIELVKQGTVLLITGKTANKRSEVIFGGTRRWAYTAYLSKARPTATAEPGAPDDGGSLGSETLDRTNAYAHVIVREISAKFPQVKTIYGWRMHSAYSSDHPSGRALDLMIPKYSTAGGKSLGDSIARYLQNNHKRLHVHYLIWRQRIWNVERSTNVTAWRTMSDRGGVTANHLNHVHVSVYDVK